MRLAAIPFAMYARLARHWRDATLIASLLLVSVPLSLASLPQASAGASAPLAAVFLPWVSADDAVARSLAAGARILRLGTVPFVVVLAPESAVRPDGAVLMLRLDGLAGCLIPTGAETSRP